MYAFIHIPKTAGSTFRHILRRSYGLRHLDIKVPPSKRNGHAWISADDFRKANRIYPHLAGICGHRVTCFSDLQEEQGDLKFFTFVREPLARFVSHFKHSRRKNPENTTAYNFLQFCDDPHQQNVQCRWIGGDQGPDTAMAYIRKHIEFVGLTEEFDTSMVLFKRWINCPDFQPHYTPRNIHPIKLPFNPLDDPKLLEAAENANEGDIKLYQQIVSDIFPAQIERYGETLSVDLNRFKEDNQSFEETGEPLFSRLKRNCVYKPLQHLGAA